MILYAVNQYQPNENYIDRTIAIFDNEITAEKYKRELNKEYGNRKSNDNEEAHHYWVEDFILNEKY